MDTNTENEELDLDEDEFSSKIPAKYRDIDDTDAFERIKRGRDYWE